MCKMKSLQLKLIDFVKSSKPKIFWEMDRINFEKIKNLQDDNGRYLIEQKENRKWMFGYPLYISKSFVGIRLGFVFGQFIKYVQM